MSESINVPPLPAYVSGPSPPPSAVTTPTSLSSSPTAPMTPTHAYVHGPSGHLFAGALAGLSHVSGSKQFFPSPQPICTPKEVEVEQPTFSSLYTMSTPFNSLSSSSSSASSVTSSDDEHRPIQPLLYHRRSLPYYEEEDDTLCQESFCPSMELSGPPSSMGLCEGRAGDKKNCGSECRWVWLSALG